MSPPHALKTFSNGGGEDAPAEVGNMGRSSTADDFDSVFGEPPPTVRRSSPKKIKDPIKVESLDQQGDVSYSSIGPIQMTRGEANDLIKDILSRKPPTISPTLPRFHGGGGELREMSADPLDCSDSNDQTRTLALRPSPGANPSSDTLSKRPRAKAVTVPSKLAANRALPGKLPTPREPSRPSATDPTASTPSSVPKTRGPASGRLKDYILLVEDIQKKERFMDTIEDWKDVIKALEKTETIESAKSPRDSTLLASFALLASWIAEHLVDLIVKRIQAKCIVSIADPPVLLSLATQISVLRETARQCHLRGHHFLSTSQTSSSRDIKHPTNYQDLDQFISSLCKL